MPIHQGAAARKLATDYFRRYPKDAYQTEVESWRNLQSGKIEFMVKRLRADRRHALMREAGWSKLFEDPVTLPNGRQLVTLLDAGNYIASLPRKETQSDHWQVVSEALLDGAPRSWAAAACARRDAAGAEYRQVERVFKLYRKESHWGKRKLARDR